MKIIGVLSTNDVFSIAVVPLNIQLSIEYLMVKSRMEIKPKAHPQN